MGGITEKITEFIKDLLTGWITSNLDTMFTDVNTKVETIATEVGKTPQNWNSGIFSMIKNLSDNVIVPIAGMIITFVLCYELISMIMEKNNMHDTDTFMFFKYIFKMWVAVYLVTHTFDIAMAIFDVANHVVSNAGGMITGSASIDVTEALKTLLETQIEDMGIGELLGLGLETMLVSLCLKIISVLIPMIPENWKYQIKESTKGQFRVLKELLHRADITEVICATDAGREGELIFRLVYNQAECKLPFKRLWISSMEEKAILEGFQQLKDGHEYDDLYYSAVARSEADWLVGINATRLFTVLYHHRLIVGRVQTPTLAMLVEREKSIENFQKEKYYLVHLLMDGLDAVSNRIKEKSAAVQMMEDMKDETAQILSVKKEKKKVQPPKLYDLTTLQREANRS